MNANHEDQNAREIDEAQLTAYALGQLTAKEREAAEAVLARSAETRQYVEETAALAGHMRQAYEQSPTLTASALLRAEIEKRLNVPIAEGTSTVGSIHAVARTRAQRLTVWFVGATTGLVLAASLLVAITIAPSRPEQIACQHLSCPMSSLPTAMKSSDEGREYVGRITGQVDCQWSDPAAGTPYGSSQSTPLGVLGRGVGQEADGKPRNVTEFKGDPFRLAREDKENGWHHGRLIYDRDESAIRSVEGPTTSPGTEQYDPSVENRFLSVARQSLSTFSIDVDTASYANVRRFLMNEGRLPPPDAVRIEEMINYFAYDYSPPSGRTPFSVHMETAECPWQPAHRLVRVGLKGREIDRHERGPSNLVFLLDVSGSMDQPNKLPLVKQAMRMLVEQLQADDRVAIVTYASGTGVPLPSARGDERKRIIAAIESLQSGGSTAGSAGIELAYEQAQAHFVEGGVNRVFLCTDGDLNVGITNDDDLVRLIERKAKTGVFLTVLGFGTGNLKDGKLEKLADKGNGIYAYIDGLREAHRVLVEQMTGSLVTIAKDVKIQVEFNPAEVAAYRLVGYENRVMANRDFDNDRKDAGDIGAGHTVTALYELVPAHGNHAAAEGDRPLKYQRVAEEDLSENAQSGELLTLRLRYKEPDQDESRLLEFVAKDTDARFGRASADFRFASAVAAFGMVLRGSPQRGEATLAAVEEYAAGALGKDPNGHRAEFLDLVRRAKSLAGR